MDDGGFTTGALHLYGFMGGEGGVQSARDEAGADGRRGDVKEEEW